ncbi:MAG: tyrosine-type recombinase/integrase [Dehalococcoidia bacterium]
MAGKRRGNREGSLWQRRSDGRWCGAITVEGKRRYVYAKTRQAAAEKLTALLKDAQDGLPAVGQRETVGTFAERWLDAKRPSIKASTHRRYSTLLRVNVLPTLANVSLARLTPGHLQRLYAERSAAGRGPQTITHIHRVLHGMLKDATRWGSVVRNVATLVSPPAIPYREMEVLDAEQARDFLKSTSDTNLEALWRLALGTGLRIGEIMALRWPEVDLGKQGDSDNSQVRVIATLDRYKGGYSLTEPKSAKSRRTVHLPDSVTDALRRHRARQDADRLESGQSRDDEGFVFVNSRGGPLNSTNLARRVFKPLLLEAGLPPSLTIHSLRHTAITFALSRGVAPTDVAAMAGHSSVVVTLTRYGHALPDAPRRAVDAIEAVMAEVS